MRVSPTVRYSCGPPILESRNGQLHTSRLTVELEHGAYRDRSDDLLVAKLAHATTAPNDVLAFYFAHRWAKC